MKKLLKYIIPLSILYGCGDGNYTNVEISGTVKDAKTKQPIPTAETTISCWVYSTEIWESKAIDTTVKTDQTGKFLIQFEKGEAIDLTVRSQSYMKKEISKTLSSSKVNFDIYLENKNQELDYQ